MMKQWICSAGLVAPALFFFAGCGSPEAPADLSSTTDAKVSTTLDRAFEAGRLGFQPEVLSTQKAVVDPSVVASRSELLVSPKASDPFLRPRAGFEEEGQRQVELSAVQEISAGLELSLELPRAEYALGEPIFARAVLTNVSDETLRLAPLVDPQFGYGHVVIEDQAGETLGLKPLALLCSRGDLQVEEMAPGESRTADFPIFFGSDGHLFSEPGTYKVSLLYRGITEESGRVDSNPVWVTVRGGDERDLDAAALAMDGEAGLFMMWGEGDHLARGKASLETLLELYPESPLAESARFALGRSLSHEFTDYRFDEVRQPQPAAARAYLTPVVDAILAGRSGLDAGRARDAFVLLAQVNARLGDHARATALLGEWTRLFGADASAEDVVTVRDALQGL